LKPLTSNPQSDAMATFNYSKDAGSYSYPFVFLGFCGSKVGSAWV